MDVEQMETEASSEMKHFHNTNLLNFDINQNDLDDGDQTDSLNTIRSPWKHDYLALGESSNQPSLKQLNQLKRK